MKETTKRSIFGNKERSKYGLPETKIDVAVTRGIIKAQDTELEYFGNGFGLYIPLEERRDPTDTNKQIDDINAKFDNLKLEKEKKNNSGISQNTASTKSLTTSSENEDDVSSISMWTNRILEERSKKESEHSFQSSLS